MSLSINDGKGTPVAHIFTQDAQQNGIDPAVLVNRSNANGPSFWERISSWVTLAAKANKPHVVKFKMTRPIPGTLNGNPAVMGKHEAILTLLIDQAVGAESDVLDSVTLIANMAANATIKSQVKQFAPTVV